MKRIFPLLVIGVVVAGCGLRGGVPDPEEWPAVSEAFEVAEIGDTVRLDGVVTLLGELFCPCFHLTSDGATAVVWYDLMTDEGGSFDAVDVASLASGDAAHVVGEYRSTDPGSGFPVVWAVEISPHD
jgi:hypothetical protein